MKESQLISKKNLKKIHKCLYLLLFIIISENSFFYMPTIAQASVREHKIEANKKAQYEYNILLNEILNQEKVYQNNKVINHLPKNNYLRIVRVEYHIVTAYSSSKDECDSSPCITADNFDLCKNNKENVVAVNWLKFGTKIRIPEYAGNRIFTVQDRMNKRYSNRLDIWMKNKKSAKNFGVKFYRIEILDSL